MGTIIEPLAYNNYQTQERLDHASCTCNIFRVAALSSAIVASVLLLVSPADPQDPASSQTQGYSGPPSPSAAQAQPSISPTIAMTGLFSLVMFFLAAAKHREVTDLTHELKPPEPC